MEIQHWIRGHEHPLRLREDAAEKEELSCQICNSRVESGVPFYACESCTTGFYAHKSCSDLPHQIQHPFHPHSPLTFLPKMPGQCHYCLVYFKDSQFYNCGSCDDFRMDGKCALMPMEGRDWIRHFGHAHPLLLRVEDHITKCFGCQSTSRGDDHQALYGCSDCGYFLHKSCARLPLKLHLPVHRHHREGFKLCIKEKLRCEECGTIMEDRYNFRFDCKECNLWICFKCAGITSSRNIEYENHQHPLCLVVNDKETASLPSQCNGYDLYCTQRVVTSSYEFKKTESTMLWCFYCDFKVHLLCGPLPAVIRHEFHIHSLVLVDSLAEDDSGEYYCDVCETKRDPRIRLYCCLDCKYFAHIHCLIPEVVKAVVGDRRDVELKSVGHDIWNVPCRELIVDRVGPANLTLKNLINELSEYDKRYLQRYYRWDRKEKQDDYAKVGDEEIDEILQLSQFSEGGFRSFWCSLIDYFYANEVELKWSDIGMRIVKGYMIPHSLAPVLNKLLCEFGDIGSVSGESLRFKSFVLFVICKTVRGMHTTIPKCITKNLLQEWYYHLKFAEGRGFKVEFAQKQLEKLVHVFLGFQSKSLKHEIPTILRQKLAELQRKSNELLRKLDECNEVCGSTSKSKYEEYCVNMASDFEWKINALEENPWSH